MRTEPEGKYDELAEKALKETGAEMVLVIVVGGEQGDGFSASTTHPQRLIEVPSVLRAVAAKIEDEFKREWRKGISGHSE